MEFPLADLLVVARVVVMLNQRGEVLNPPSDPTLLLRV